MLFFKKSEKDNKMKYIAPDYYKKFNCIADRCRHSCCIGWEIDIDEDTYEKYRFIQNSFGQKLNDNIQIDNDTPSFKLDSHERCPFLNKNNLCDIILNIGEDYLCQICRDHPRFRNFYFDRIEIGLGLCCEEVARIIIEQNSPTQLILLSDDGEITEVNNDKLEFFDKRNKIFSIIQNREKSLELRIKKLLSLFDLKMPEKNIDEWVEIYLQLEQLDPIWTNLLLELKKHSNEINSIKTTDNFNVCFEQILFYFLYRHLADSLDDGRFSQRILFAIHGTYFINLMCRLFIIKNNALNTEDLIEIARMYSSEIEYSEENINSLLEVLGQ